jgi:hypothetical protein
MHRQLKTTPVASKVPQRISDKPEHLMVLKTKSLYQAEAQNSPQQGWVWIRLPKNDTKSFP